MAFELPKYIAPDFSASHLKSAAVAKFVKAPADGIAPDNYHGTSNFPEYVHVQKGKWLLTPESRMDCTIVLKNDQLEVVEGRRLRQNDLVAVGRTENGEEGIFVHTEGFVNQESDSEDKFAFRTRGTRETPFSRSYDDLYELLKHEKENGHISWVLGPAVAFDKDSRFAMEELMRSGYCHSLMAGNALATHDLEASIYKTGLGQDIYQQTLQHLGHYNHLDILNMVRSIGSIKKTIKEKNIQDGIIYACEKYNIPYVLAGSIRDDGPLPEVISDVYKAQDIMRGYARKATTVIAMATQLHTIAFGNMSPGFKILDNGSVRPVYFYVVDMSEFCTDKLANRGSAQATAILTNVQDFIINIWHNLAENQ